MQELLKRSVILERDSERFGILGVVTQDAKTISSPGPNVQFLDYVTSVQEEVNHLKAVGVNKIILLSHFGYSVDLAQIPKLSGVDIVISGHDHALLGDSAIVEKIAPGQGTQVKGPYPTVVIAADGAPVLIVSDYEWGRWLGKLKVSFDERGVIQHWDGQPIFVRGCKFVRGEIDCSQQIAPEDPEVKAQVATYRGPVDRLSSEVIGKSGMFFDGNRNRGVRTQEMPLGNLIADTLLAASFKSDHAVAAFINGGGIRAGLNAGDVTFENALEVLPFGNTLVVVELKGDELVAALDYGVSRPGEGAFPQVSGLKLVYCTSKLCPTALRPGGRVIALTVNSVPVDLTVTYRIAINSFMANGGDGYAMLKDICARSDRYCRDTGVLKLDLLIDEFKTKSPVVRRVEERIVTQ